MHMKLYKFCIQYSKYPAYNLYTVFILDLCMCIRYTNGTSYTTYDVHTVCTFHTVLRPSYAAVIYSTTYTTRIQ